MKIGFIGLGTMGLPMTKNLLKAGFQLVVYSRSREPINTAVELGAEEAKTAKELAEQVDVVLTTLPLPDDVFQVYFAEEGIIAGARPGTILIDHSTVGPELNTKIYEVAKKKGVSFIDAPISGGPMGAEAATLTIMAGGDKEKFDIVQPIFEAIGRTILYLGGVGSGSTAKLINNMLVGIHTAAFSEAFVLGAKAGISSEMLAKVILNSTGKSYMIERLLPRVQERDFQQRFSIALLQKDIKLATALADQLLMPLQLTKLAKEMIDDAKNEGYGHEDIAAIIKPLERKAHIQVE